MTKITIEIGGTKSTVETEGDHIDLHELLTLVNQAILGAGYVPEGTLQYNEEGRD